VQKPAYSPEKNASLLWNRIEELRASLRGRNPARLAVDAGLSFAALDGSGGEFRLSLWDKPVAVTVPEYRVYELSSGRDCGAVQQGLLLYYLYTADGFQPGDSWISFTELPDGRFYSQAFQGYSGDELTRTFGDQREVFEQAAVTLGGVKHGLGDACYAFQLLPRVSLLAVCWLGDEDFTTKYQILFTSNVSHYLPTDACAIAGSMLTHRLIGACLSTYST
jgi:hypothetical protein